MIDVSEPVATDKKCREPYCNHSPRFSFLCSSNWDKCLFLHKFSGVVNYSHMVYVCFDFLVPSVCVCVGGGGGGQGPLTGTLECSHEKESLKFSCLRS